MKNFITLIIVLSNLIGYSQCPAPSNVTISDNMIETTLSWTENGTALDWQIVVIPYYDIGTPIPTSAWIPATNNPFTLTNLPPTCNAFFIRSVCSPSEFSPWSVAASSFCSANVYAYLATLSNNSFLLNPNNSLQIFPNPSKNVVHIANNSRIDKISIFDSLGKLILMQAESNNEIDIEQLSKGVYLIEMCTENQKIYRRLIKE